MEFGEWLKEYIYDEKSIKALDQMNREWMISQSEDIGRDKGLIEGERKANINTAKNLKTMNIPIENIAKATGLSVKEIKYL